eukprot:COSAG02_NODE_4747_length_5030_cov_83.260799_5_plen_173_part_00
MSDCGCPGDLDVGRGTDDCGLNKMKTESTMVKPTTTMPMLRTGSLCCAVLSLLVPSGLAFPLPEIAAAALYWWSTRDMPYRRQGSPHWGQREPPCSASSTASPRRLNGRAVVGDREPRVLPATRRAARPGRRGPWACCPWQAPSAIFIYSYVRHSRRGRLPRARSAARGRSR